MIATIILIILAMFIFLFWADFIVKVLLGSGNQSCLFISATLGVVSVYFFYDGLFSVSSMNDPYLWLVFAPAYLISAYVGGSSIAEKRIKDNKLTDKAQEVIDLEKRIKDLRGEQAPKDANESNTMDSIEVLNIKENFSYHNDISAEEELAVEVEGDAWDKGLVKGNNYKGKGILIVVCLIIIISIINVFKSTSATKDEAPEPLLQTNHVNQSKSSILSLPLNPYDLCRKYEGDYHGNGGSEGYGCYGVGGVKLSSVSGTEYNVGGFDREGVARWQKEINRLDTGMSVNRYKEELSLGINEMLAYLLELGIENNADGLYSVKSWSDNAIRYRYIKIPDSVIYYKFYNYKGAVVYAYIKTKGEKGVDTIPKRSFVGIAIESNRLKLPYDFGMSPVLKGYN